MDIRDVHWTAVIISKEAPDCRPRSENMDIQMASNGCPVGHSLDVHTMYIVCPFMDVVCRI